MKIQSIQRISNFFEFNLKNKAKIYIYPNLNGIGLGLFIFFCFLISVFYENNSALLISIIIFFIFFISIFVSHQNINSLNLNHNQNFVIEAGKSEIINIQIINLSNEKKLNIDVDYKKQTIGNYNFNRKVNTVRLKYFNKRRGKYCLDKIVLKSIYPFGVIRTKVPLISKSEIYIYPTKIRPNDKLLNEFQINKLKNADEFDGLDDYKYGDSYSKIAWKKSSGKNKYVKVFSDVEKQSHFILNLNKYEEINFELLLGYAVYIIHYFFDNKKKLIIKHRNNVFELNSSQNSLNKILKYLSNVEK